MRTLLLISGTLFLMTTTVFAQQESFTIKGKVSNLNIPATVYLVYQSNKSIYINSMELKNGKFELSGVGTSLRGVVGLGIKHFLKCAD
ncbi:DUF4369 domain-containing protein [Parapedobacter sp. 10938]|uniref:DUF4369 domain-containing protein n=1 Tax=Parapedobacter flavus TaxID=3110225 RepID=UPI002DBFBBA2|nr:DUF4369 domain-containing protein [Parapedobacter sp. 10938]MEC3878155.1 DUF4369 domain-containing protein [Parapedobacter sp. 10938]